MSRRLLREKLGAASITALLMTLGAGCAAGTTVIGPFVKSITRQGNTLRIESCPIILKGNQLLEGECRFSRIPLDPPASSPDLPSADGQQSVRAAELPATLR